MLSKFFGVKLEYLNRKENLDPSQYGNQQGMSVQHYLIKMLNRILTVLDKKHTTSESMAVILNLVDWRQAFDRQCPRLGIESLVCL